jgi:hypothetical protein
VWNAFRETILEYPVALERRLQAPGATQFQLEPKHSVALTDLIRWNEWLDDLVTHGCPWNAKAFRYYGPLTETQTLDAFVCTIREIEGLGLSKAPIENYTELDDVAVNETDLAREVSAAKLQENLAWDAYHGVPRIDGYSFSKYQWDGRIFWDNEDGSHHFVAARYLAGQLGVRLELKPRPLHVFSLYEPNLRLLLADWDVFALHDIFDQDLFCSGNAPPRCMPSLHECLRFAEVPHLWANLPRPHAGCLMWLGGTARMGTGTTDTLERDRKNGKTALFLPRHEPRARRIAALLRQASAFDLGAYLSDLVERQRLFAQGTTAQAAGQM